MKCAESPACVDVGLESVCLSKQQKYDEGLKNFLAVKKLQLSDMPHSRSGSQVLRNNSSGAYSVHLNGLRAFCAVIGDYESALITRQCFCRATQSAPRRVTV